MVISRRKFLKAGGLVVLSTGVPLKIMAGQQSLSDTPQSIAGHKIPNGSPLNAAFHLRMETFTSQLNTKFQIHHEATKVTEVKLIEVTDLRAEHFKRGAGEADKECFSIVFLGPRRTPLQQNTYAMDHHELGRFDVLLVPIGKSNQGLYYEAVFNRLFG